MNPISSILNTCKRKRLNILTAPTHERYETMLSKTNADFWAFESDKTKTWDEVFAKKPENYHILPKCDSLGDLLDAIPGDITIDLVLSQQKFGQFQVLKNVSQVLQVPMISLEHTLPLTCVRNGVRQGWDDERLASLRNMNGDYNVFISEMSKNTWLYDYSPNNIVIEHGVDTELFNPNTFSVIELENKICKYPYDRERKNKCLSVVNDFINRDVFCGYKIWTEIMDGIPCDVLGKTPGLSEPAKTTEELVKAYQSHSVFVNTSQISPIPSVLLEAMSCGCAIVSTATCMIPEVIENGYNGFLSNDISELRKHILFLLENPEEARKMGENARKTIVERFPLDRFVNQWNKLFEKVVYD